ncbi:MAG TPA: hypothetical protein VJO12_02135 [Stellaceae bacterium]|nr:hypothetical protein [Stellaceae bacterium]
MDEQADIRKWRARADALRRLADAAATQFAKERALEVARGYELLADEVAARREEDDGAQHR